MKSFKNFITEQEISKGDMKKLQRAAASKSPEQTKRILDSLESAQERASRRTRTVPSAKSSSTVDQTPINQYIRGQQEKGIRVSQELTDTAGVRAAAERGDIKPVQAGGETKPSPGATNRARARGAAARQGVDISAPESKLKPRGQRLVNVTKGGPVKVIKPTQPAPAPKPEAVKKPVPTVSRRGALSKQVDPILKDLRSQGASQRALERRMSTGYDAAVTRKGEEVLKQIRADAKTASTPKPTAAPKPAAAPKPRSVQLPNVTKPAPTRVAPPPLTQNKFLRPTPTAQPKPTAAPAPVTQPPAPKPQFKGSKQFAPGSSGTVSTDKNALDIIDDKPSRSKAPRRTSAEVLKLQRSVNRGIRQRAASGLLKGAGVAAAGLEARGEYLSRLDKGQSQSTALKGSAARVGGGWAGAKAGAATGAKIGSVLGPKGAAAGGLLGGVAGYVGGAQLGTAAYDAARNFKFSNFQKKIDKFRKLDAKKYSTF